MPDKEDLSINAGFIKKPVFFLLTMSGLFDIIDNTNIY